MRARVAGAVVDTWCPGVVLVGSVVLFGVGGSATKVLAWCGIALAVIFVVVNRILLKGRRGAGLGKVVETVIAMALLVGVTGTAYVQSYRPESSARGTEQGIATIAADAVAAVLSYESATAAEDTTAAQKYLAGDFLQYFRDFTSQVVVPAAEDKGITMKATVVGTGVLSAEPNGASVLVFVNQLAGSADGSPPTTTQTAIEVHLEKRDGAWKIVQFQPVI
jgi:hypothetical protein